MQNIPSITKEIAKKGTERENNIEKHEKRIESYAIEAEKKKHQKIENNATEYFTSIYWKGTDN